MNKRVKAASDAIVKAIYEDDKADLMRLFNAEVIRQSAEWYANVLEESQPTGRSARKRG